MYEVFAKVMCRPCLKIIIYLSEFEERRLFTFLRRQRIDFALEVIIHLSEFKKLCPLTFLRRQRVDFA